MENNKLISVIVPVYKVEKYLEKCIESIISQSYKNLEIILVDDGSPDGCGKICDAYAEKDKRIKVIHQENRGLCGARNTGLRAATGDYIGFVDSDDYISEDMYEYLGKSLEKYDADVVSCRYFRVGREYDGYTEKGEYDVIMTGREAVRELVGNFILRSLFWNKLFRREILDGFSFPEGRTFEGTLTMHHLLLKCRKVIMLCEPKYYYLDNSDSIVNTKNIKNGLDYCLSHITRFEELKEDFPELCDKMLRDTVRTIRVLRYVCSNVTEDEIERSRDKFEKIKSFVEENKEYIYRNILTDRFARKEMDSILLLTPGGFRRAHDMGGISLRLEKLMKKLGRGRVNSEETGEERAPEMTPERTQTLLRLQDVLREMLGVTDKICRENDIEYFLCGGTMLGAVRNGDIISWDDDIDILMLREDYDRFAEVCRKKLPAQYFYQTGLSDPQFSNIAAKIRKNGTYFPEKRWRKRNFNKGIFIDIFPLDAYPKNKLMAKAVMKYISLIQQIVSLDECHSKNPIVRIFYAFGKRKPKEYWYRKRDNVFAFCAKHADKDRICSYGSHYKNKRILKREWFSETEDILFGGEKRLAMKGYKEYLTYLFGEDYMTPPPQEKRVCHAELDRIDFGENK